MLGIVEIDMNSSSVFGKILLPVIMFSLILLVILILIFANLPIDRAEKLGSFLSGITSVGLICISIGSIYATIYIAKSINDLSTETRREDEYAERMIDVLQKMLDADTLLRDAIDKGRGNHFHDFKRERTIKDLIIQQKSYSLFLKYYCSKHPKSFNGLNNDIDLFIENPANTNVLIRIVDKAMYYLLNV